MMRSRVNRVCEYYFSPVSPWAYLGHQRLLELAQQHQIIIEMKPVPVAASSSDLDLQSFRNAARQYFTGAGQKTVVPASGQSGEKVTVTRKAPGEKSGGGC